MSEPGAQGECAASVYHSGAGGSMEGVGGMRRSEGEALVKQPGAFGARRARKAGKTAKAKAQDPGILEQGRVGQVRGRIGAQFVHSLTERRLKGPRISIACSLREGVLRMRRGGRRSGGGVRTGATRYRLRMGLAGGIERLALCGE
jgi:hypothetical protein